MVEMIETDISITQTTVENMKGMGIHLEEMIIEDTMMKEVTISTENGHTEDQEVEVEVEGICIN